MNNYNANYFEFEILEVYYVSTRTVLSTNDYLLEKLFTDGTKLFTGGTLQSLMWGKISSLKLRS